MKVNLSKKYICVSFLICSMALMLFQDMATAQHSDLTVDELYKQARTVAFEEKNYEKARKLAYKALRKTPDYHGIRVFVARTYAWEGKYDEAREALEYVLKRDNNNRGALSAMIDVVTWAGNDQKVLKWTEKALKHNPKEKAFMLARALAYQNLGQYTEAEQMYREILTVHPNSRRARQRLRVVRLQQMKYKARFSYQHERFSKGLDPWNIWEFQLSRQTGMGPLIGRIQYGERFSSTGTQFNIDAYPSFSDGWHAYLSGGYSSATSVFPKYRFSFSFYKSLPSNFEAEAGIRYMDFKTSQTTFYTFSISKYWERYLFTARSYLIPDAPGGSSTFLLMVRRYFGDPDAYVGITGGMGTATSDIQFAEDIQQQSSRMIKVETQYPLNRRINIGGFTGYEAEKLSTYDRNRFNFEIYLSYRF